MNKKYTSYHQTKKTDKIKIEIECNSPSEKALDNYVDKLIKLYTKHNQDNKKNQE